PVQAGTAVDDAVGRVDPVLERGGECLQGFVVGAGLAYGRHHAGAQTLDYRLTHFWGDVDVRRAEAFKVDATGIILEVVAFRAVLLDELVAPRRSEGSVVLGHSRRPGRRALCLGQRGRGSAGAD